MISVILLVLFAESAFAYLDPGTGSMLLQVILACIHPVPDPVYEAVQ